MLLASAVISSRHPTWAMFLAGIYHARKVDMTRDGRTDTEKNRENYRPYQVLCHEIVEEQMYENARRLRQLGFDAPNATLGILYQRKCPFTSGWIFIYAFELIMSSHFLSGKSGLRWGIYETLPNSNGMTTTDYDGSIHIFLNANTIWPLLSNVYTEGEKVAIRFKLASTMLHELSVRLLLCFKTGYCH